MVSITTVDEGAVCTAMLDLYQNEGIIAEPAGALSVAALLEADIEPGSTVVCLISGGNNDVSRYGEVLERSLVHLGLKHYFLVDFPQEPGALRRFLDTVLGPNDDITLFEYVKRNNRETGEALVGIELGSAADSRVCWSGCRPPTSTSRRWSPARRRIATCSRRGRDCDSRGDRRVRQPAVVGHQRASAEVGRDLGEQGRPLPVGIRDGTLSWSGQQQRHRGVVLESVQHVEERCHCGFHDRAPRSRSKRNLTQAP